MYTSFCACLKDADGSRIHCWGSTPIYKGCNEFVRGIGPFEVHSRRSTARYKGSNEWLKGVDPSRTHRMGSTAMYKSSSESRRDRAP